MNKPDDPNGTNPAGDAGMLAAGTTTTLGKVLRDGSLQYKAPASLRERLRDELAHAERHSSAAAQSAQSAQSIQGTHTSHAPQASPAADTPKPPAPKPAGKPRSDIPVDAAWGPRLAPWLFGGTGGAILGGLAVAMALLTVRPPVPQTDVQSQVSGLQPQEIVASHVRALLSQHPIDVISTDQHTVKPWFNGRIDYAPPVVDLTDKGFPLSGGRLDYVGGRTVAVLVYHTDKHPIDLYVFPSKDKAAAAPTVTASDGYAIARWRRGGMTYWAITDAQASHLRVFIEALQAAT
jgi:anti-sigma factor RsiW